MKNKNIIGIPFSHNRKLEFDSVITLVKRKSGEEMDIIMAFLQRDFGMSEERAKRSLLVLKKTKDIRIEKGRVYPNAQA